MPPVPPERFTRLFRGLDADARTAFVAALWDERGWETTAEGTIVTAKRKGVTERVRVVDPGRFRTPQLEDVDVLVVARERDPVRAAAEAAGVRYLAPSDVRDLLLYGLERPTAKALFERTFDRPLERTDEPPASLRERARAAGVAAATVVEDRADPRLLAVLLLVGLLVGAAVGGPALAPGREQTVVTSPVESVTPGDVGAVGERTGTLTPSPTPGAGSEDGGPPGLSEGTLVDHVALADAHAQAVVGESRTLRIEANGPSSSPLLNGREAWNTTAWIAHSHHFRFEGRYVFSGENGSESQTVAVSVYASGETKYRQVRRPNGTIYQRYPIRTTGDARGYALEVREYLVLLLDGNASTVECAGTLAEGDCFAYRLVVTGAPAAIHAEAENYRAVAIVQENGVVSSLIVTYTLPVDGERVPVEFRLNYDDFGETSVSPPEWLDTAQNETSG